MTTSITREEYMELVGMKQEEQRNREVLTEEEAEAIIIKVFRDSPDFLALYFEVKADMLELQKKDKWY